MKRKAVLIVLLLSALLGLWYLYQQKLVPSDGTLHSTGTVEGLEINITSKISGRIARLSFAEGDSVQAAGRSASGSRRPSWRLS